MLQENLQINIGANTQDLQSGLNQATNSVNNFTNSLQKANKPTGDATQSLVNLSRIAQDAPYGFLGIANNLNPMLESFQRLQKESGGAGEALKAMASGLMGPAGIGLALGVVSSLVVAYGSKISEFISGTNEASKSQDEFNKKLLEAQSKASENGVKLMAYLRIADDVSVSDNRRAEALQSVKTELSKVNEEYTKTIKSTDDARAAVELYTQSLIAEAITSRYKEEIADKTIKLTNVTKEALKAATEYNHAVATSSQMTNGYVDASVHQASVMSVAKNNYIDLAKSAVGLSDSIRELNKDLDANIKSQLDNPFFKMGKTQKSGIEENVNDFSKALKTFNAALLGEDTLLQNNLQSTQQNLDNKIKIYDEFIKKLAGINTEQAKAKIQELLNPLGEMQMTKFEERIKDAYKFIDNQQGEVIKGPKEPEGGSNKILLNALTGETGEKQDDKKFDAGKKGMDNFFKDNKKKFDEAQKAAEDFANTISQEVTGGLMTMWEAMESGENPLQALGNFFKDLLKQLAAAVIQALIFQGIMSALGMGGVASGGGGLGGGLIGGIGKIFGFAEGGIVSQPTLSMVGEGGQSEAIMPLNKLGSLMNSTFNAGAMSGQGGGGGNGQFVLKGNDLVLAMQRSNFSLNVRR